MVSKRCWSVVISRILSFVFGCISCCAFIMGSSSLFEYRVGFISEFSIKNTEKVVYLINVRYTCKKVR